MVRQKSNRRQEPKPAASLNGGKRTGAKSAASAKRAASRSSEKSNGQHRPDAETSAAANTISRYLIDRMYDLGIRTVFGIPGDYVLGFYDELYDSKIAVIGTTREDCAGYAADAYARVRGLGAVCVTYCVGGLSIANSIAGAYAEKSPLLVISGSPGLRERTKNALLHHKVRDFSTQKEVFEKITVASCVLDDSLTAFREVDRVIEAVLRYKRPGYIELPRDMVSVSPMYDHKPLVPHFESDPKELREAVDETCGRIDRAKRPVLLVGVEVHRFGLQDLVLAIAEKNKLPLCSTLLGKSVVSESHPLYVGVYEGAMGQELPRRVVEESDCVLMLGTFMTDINLGIDTAHLEPARCIRATSEDLRVSYHHYQQVQLVDFVRELSKKKFQCAPTDFVRPKQEEPTPFKPRKVPVTVKRLFEKVNSILREDMVVICDVGDSLFAGADLTIRRRTEFLSPAYYTSMGFAVPAALGVLCAKPDARPIVMVGDGAFQMTGMELSTIFRHGLAPIVVVLNNKGYSTERFIMDGGYNDIGNWNYHKIPEVIGGGWGFEVHTETDLEKALDAALANKDAFSLLNVHLDPYDRSEAMERLTARLAARIPDSGNPRA